MGFGVSVLHAKDFSTYRIGSIAGEDIVAPVALDVIDPAATAALKSAEAAKTPAIFRSYIGATNTLAGQFNLAFASARTNFISALQDTFHQAVLNHAAVTSPDFGYLVTAFNIENKKFPVPDFLAMDWAYGKTGDVEKNKFLNALLQQMQSPIRPDDVDDGFETGKMLRLVPVKNPDEKMSLAEAETRGQIISGSNLLTVAQARMQFRREFNTYEEQPLARALSEWLQPNCRPDGALTQSARDQAVRQLVVAEHYTAGQIIAAQGSVIDAKTKAALDQLNEKPAAQAIAAEPAHDLNVASTPLATSPQPTETFPTSIPTIATTGHSKKFSTPRLWFFVALTIFIAATLLSIWQLILRHRRVAKILPAQKPFELQSELTSPLVRVVKEALVQELAVQRRELLYAQQLATAEVVGLVRKMDGLQLAMQERWQTYESQIQKLETELADRTEENRELLQLKIEMIRRQLETERAGKRITFN